MAKSSDVSRLPTYAVWPGGVEMRKNLWCFVVLLSAALVLPGTALAQTGGISGEVVDETGGVLPGVTATATSPGVIDVRTAVTGGDGRYTFVGLTPGIYLVEFTLPGFSTVRREGIELSAGFTANIDIQMVVGGVEETVTVTGATPTVTSRTCAHRTPCLTKRWISCRTRRR